MIFLLKKSGGYAVCEKHSLVGEYVIATINNKAAVVNKRLNMF